MRFQPVAIAGAFLIEPDEYQDERGSFYRTFCRDEFSARGLATELVQSSISRNTHRGTIRGLHFQSPPEAETKVVRCIRGVAYDVMVDLRVESETYCRWYAVELSAANGHGVYIPAGVAHGFQTLDDATDLLYQMDTKYVPSLSRGVRWDDPAFSIEWPLAPIAMSAKDRSYPDFDRLNSGLRLGLHG